MKMTRVRDYIAAVFVLLLVAVFVGVLLHVMGKPVPIISDLLGG